MKVCDMCGKKISRYNYLNVGDFCPRCYNKIRKYIKFEIAKNQKDKHR